MTAALILCHEHGAYCGAPGLLARACFGLSSVHPHPLSSRADDCPECHDQLSRGRQDMTEWKPDGPWMRYDGDNGEAIAAAMTDGRAANAGGGQRHAVVVNAEHQGDALSLSEERTTVLPDRWRVPVGYWINPSTGECRNEQGVPQDFDALTAEG